jgi:hypothetical protein
MHKYTRKYYIHDQEVSLETLMKYIEIDLTHGKGCLKTLGVSVEVCKSDI